MNFNLLEKLKNNYRNLLSNFWFLNITGWLVFGIIFIPFAYNFYGPETYKVILAVGSLFLWFAISIILRKIYQRFDLNKDTYIKIGLWIIIISFISTFLFERINDIARVAFIGWEKGIKQDTFFGMFYEVIWGTPLILTWSLFYFVIKIFGKFEKEKEEAQRAKTIATEAQLEMLRYQLNPHFIFNSLSSLRALVQKDPEKAKNMIMKLSDFLRYALIENYDSEVPLSKELEIIRSYLEIEKVRFGDDLEVVIDSDQLSLEYPVPSFILHPLVDNAIKHGPTSEIPRLDLFINTFVNNDNTLEIRIRNSGSIKCKNQIGTKTGLQNVKQRLFYLYNHQASFTLEEKDNFVIAVIKIKKPTVHG